MVLNKILTIIVKNFKIYKQVNCLENGESKRNRGLEFDISFILYKLFFEVCIIFLL